VGHGLRERQLRGPTEVEGQAREQVVQQRRFRCRSCGAVMVVAPVQVLRRRLFSSVAIALGLSLYGIDRQPAAAVRERINPWRVVGATAARGWQTLLNWAAAAGLGALLPMRRTVSGTPRQVASAVCRALSALAPPAFRAQSVNHQVVAGTVHALMGIRP
jgi:hypothetical protein